MNQDEIMHLFEETGAIIRNSHLVYTSGRHGSAYVNKDALYPHTDITAKLCNEMAGRFAKDNIDVVVGPAMGGVILSQWVAFYLSAIIGRKVFSVYVEADENKNKIFGRGYDKFIGGKNILIVEDVLTTGGSVKKVVDAVRAKNGNVAGCIALCNRGGVRNEDIGTLPRFEALVNIKFDSWDEGQCPLCRSGVPVNTSVGKGRDFLARKGK